jgi:hypothetical protein
LARFWCCLDNALFASRSPDSGVTWTNGPFDPAGGAFGDNPLDDFNDDTIAGPRLAARGSTLFAIFPQGILGDFPTRLGFARSTDQGATWPAADIVTAFTSHRDVMTSFYLGVAGSEHGW